MSAVRVLFILFYWTLIASVLDALITDPKPVFSWRQLNYAWSGDFDEAILWPSDNKPGFEMPKQTEAGPAETEARDAFNPEMNVPMGVTKWKNRLFITVPRRRLGIPATLNHIRLSSRNQMTREGIPLTPYPSWEMNRAIEGHLVSVYRTTVDKCDRLWFIDTGLLELPGNPQRIQPAALHIYDLNTNKMLHRYEFPEDVITPSTTLASLAVDIPNNECSNAFAYIPDLSGYGLIVYSLRQEISWRFSHNFFHQDPIGGNFRINELRFQWDDGIFSISLGKPRPDTYRTAYFHAMASTHEFSVSTRILRNASNAERSYHNDDFIHLGDKGPDMQTSMANFDKGTEVLFYALVNQNAIGCWNTKKPFTKENHVVLYKNDRKFVYPGDLTVDSEGNVWVLTNTMPYFIYSSLNVTDVNFRVWKFNAQEAIKETKCN